MSDENEPDGAMLLEQLIEARDKLRRELEILLTPSTIGGGADNREVIALLSKELHEIEAILANH
jgi:hypothetical protein